MDKDLDKNQDRNEDIDNNKEDNNEVKRMWKAILVILSITLLLNIAELVLTLVGVFS